MKSVVHLEDEQEVMSGITKTYKAGEDAKETAEYSGLPCNKFTEWEARQKKSYLPCLDRITRFF